MTPPPFPTPADPSLEAVSDSATLRKIYPRDLFPNPQTARLPLGNTGYWLFGPEEGPKVTLIHGIYTPSVLWKYIAPFLADNGFRVLVYDLWGRGYSEAPRTATHDTNLYITQLALLLQHIGWTQTHILGNSMGGGIAAAFAATFPNLMAGKVVLIAPSGLMDLHQALPSNTVQEVTSERPVGAKFAQQIRELQTECLPGFAQALASSAVHGPLAGLENAYKAIYQTSHLKSLVIHGTADDVIPYQIGLKIKEYIPNVDFFTIEGANHDLTIADGYYQKAQDAIVRFLKG